MTSGQSRNDLKFHVKYSLFLLRLEQSFLELKNILNYYFYVCCSAFLELSQKK